MSVFRTASLGLTVLAPLLGLTYGQQNSTQQNSTSECSTSEYFEPNYDSYNASGSYQIPGFYPLGTTTIPPTNWTYNTAISVDASRKRYNQSIWITTPDNTDLGSKTLPYIGCLMAIQDLPQSTVARGQDDDGDCASTFYSDCINSIVTNVGSELLTALERSRDAATVCSILPHLIIPSNCRTYTGGEIWGASVVNYINGNSSSSNGTDERECSHQKSNSAFFSWGYGKSGYVNETFYDQAVTNITPLLSVVWSKDNRTKSANPQGWVDTRFICMRNSRIQEGSRQPEGVPSLAVTAGANSLGKRVAFVVLIITTFLLW